MNIDQAAARIAELEAALSAATAERDDEKREHEYWARRGMALTKALKELPEVPPVPVLDLLSAAGNFPEDWERGKVMQRQHRLEAIPPRTEYEIGAGVWSRLLAGFRAEARAEAAEAEAARLRVSIRQMLQAIDDDAIDSHEVGADGVLPHKWHEEWAHHARAALGAGHD